MNDKDSPQGATADAAPPTTVHIASGAIVANVAYLAYGQMEDGLKRLHTFALCYRPTNNNVTWISWDRSGPDPRHEVLNMDAGLKVDRLFVGIAGADLLFSATAHQLIVQPPGVPGTARLAGVWAPVGGATAFTVPVVTAQAFLDVPLDSPFFQDIGAGDVLGISKGYSGPTIGTRLFQPGQVVNRAQAVAMIVRALRTIAGSSAQATGKKGK